MYFTSSCRLGSASALISSWTTLVYPHWAARWSAVCPTCTERVTMVYLIIQLNTILHTLFCELTSTSFSISRCTSSASPHSAALHSCFSRSKFWREKGHWSILWNTLRHWCYKLCSVVQLLSQASRIYLASEQNRGKWKNAKGKYIWSHGIFGFTKLQAYYATCTL